MNEVKQRALGNFLRLLIDYKDVKLLLKNFFLGWLKTKIHKNTFLGKFDIFSLIDRILPECEGRCEELTPTLVKYYMKWNEYEFSGIGKSMKLSVRDARNDFLDK